MLICDCGHDHHSHKLAAGDVLARELSKMVEQVWKKKGIPKLNRNLISYYAGYFTKALEEGYGEIIGGFDYDTPDGNMLAHLVQNVYHFSAAKNYTQLRQLTQALIGDDGKLRTYSQFKKAAFEINDTHVNQWLKAEYDLAVSGAQMASKWVDITGNPSTRFLEFDVVIDSKTSEICRPLHGLIVSVDDPILSTYYPPNHFFCRTTVRQKSSGPATPAHNRELPDIPPMFQANLAKEQLVFPKGHAYYTGTPEDVKKEAERAFSKRVKDWGKENLAGESVKADEIGNVSFTGSGIKEIINQPHALGSKKNLAVFNLKKMVEEGKYIQSSPDAKGNPMVKSWHYLETKIAGEKSYIVVRELISGEKTVYSIVDHLK